MLDEREGAVPQFDYRQGALWIRVTEFEIRIAGGAAPEAMVRKDSEDWQGFQPEFRLVRPRESISANPSADAYNLEAYPGADPGTVSEPSEKSTNAEPAVVAGDSEVEGNAVFERPSEQGARKQWAFRRFRESLLPGIAVAVERFQSHQWNLIDLLSREEWARDLAASNPVLAWLLANNDQFKRIWAPTPAAYARPVVGRKQREILKWLGYPATESMVRLLKKIPPEAIGPIEARLLRQAIVSDPQVAVLLAHLRRINAGVLGLVCNAKLLPAVTRPLLDEVSASEEELSRQGAADLLINAMYLALRGGIATQLPRFRSIEAINRFHEGVAAEWLRMVNEEQERKRAEEERRRATARRKKERTPLPKEFPAPPIPGTDRIVPLTTREELKREGIQQDNCVASYSHRVRNGSVYVYRVLPPLERATLSIVRGPDGCWRRAELLAARNEPVSRKTQSAVDHWLGGYALSI